MGLFKEVVSGGSTSYDRDHPANQGVDEHGIAPRGRKPSGAFVNPKSAESCTNSLPQVTFGDSESGTWDAKVKQAVWLRDEQD